MLPGLFNPMLGFGASEPPFKLKSWAAGQGSTITAPAGIKAGDVIFWSQTAHVISPDGVPEVATLIPSGFTSLKNVTKTSGSSRCRGLAAYKLANGTESGTTLQGVKAVSGQAFRATNIVAVFSGPVVSVSPSSFAGECDYDGISNQTIAASGQSPPSLAVAIYVQTSRITNTSLAQASRGFSPAQDGELDGTSIWLRYRRWTSTPSNITCSFGDDGAYRTLISGFLAATV